MDYTGYIIWIKGVCRYPNRVYPIWCVKHGNELF